MRNNHIEMLPERAFRRKTFGKGLATLEGGGGSTNTVQKSEPWWGVQQPIVDLMNRSEALSNAPYPGYTGQLYAPLSQTQNQAIDTSKQMAASGSPQVLNTATNAASGIMNGAQLANSPGLTMMNPYAGINNPYLNDVVQNTQNDITRGYQTATAPTLDAQANMAGAFGGSGWQTATANNEKQLANTLAQTSAGLRAQDYTNQQQLAEGGLNRAQQAYAQASNNQVQTLAQAPNLAQTQYGVQQGNLANLWQAGQIQQQDAQNQLNQQQNMASAQMQWPYTNLNILGQAVSLGQGNQNLSSSQSGSVNPYAAAMGLGNLGLGAYKAGLFGGSSTAADAGAATGAGLAGYSSLYGAGAYAGADYGGSMAAGAMMA